MESVYSAVRTDSLYKADYVWSLKGRVAVPLLKQSDTFKDTCINPNLDAQPTSGHKRSASRIKNTEPIHLRYLNTFHTPTLKIYIYIYNINNKEI
jgi:hypothetical protein